MTSPKLCCPHCRQFESKVIDSRAAANNAHVWRRRRCEHCHRRFTTQEIVIGTYEKSSTGLRYPNI